MSSTAPVPVASDTQVAASTSEENGNHVQPGAQAPLPERPSEVLSRMPISGSARIFSTYDSVGQLLASTDTAKGLFKSGLSDLPPLSIETESGIDRSAKESTADEKSSSGTTVKTESVVANLCNTQDTDIQNILQSAARALQSKSNNVVKDSSSSGNKKTSPGKLAGLFTSREWGSELGPYQDVDVQKVFQTSLEGTAEKSAPRQKQDKRKEAGQEPKKKRDWNAIVMGGLEAGLAKPTPRPNTGGATPADAALLAAAAAAFGERDRSGEATQKLHESPQRLSKPLKKRMNAAPVLSAMEPQPPREPVDNPVAEDASGKMFVEPSEADVLLGRGGRTNNHPGNKRYLEAKDSMQERYLAADKNGKTPISQELVDIVKGWGGRFLKLDAPTNRWYEIDNTTARKKCSQTLREVNTPEERAAKRARYAK